MSAGSMKMDLSIRRATTCSVKGGPGHSATVSSPRAAPAQTSRRVLEILADCHGKPSIVYEYRPHLGSNRLPLVVRTLRRKFEELGGEIRFSCRVEDHRHCRRAAPGTFNLIGLHRRRISDFGDRP